MPFRLALLLCNKNPSMRPLSKLFVILFILVTGICAIYSLVIVPIIIIANFVMITTLNYCLLVFVS